MDARREGALRVQFDGQHRLELHEAKITSDVGPLAGRSHRALSGGWPGEQEGGFHQRDKPVRGGDVESEGEPGGAGR